MSGQLADELQRARARIKELEDELAAATRRVTALGDALTNVLLSLESLQERIRRERQRRIYGNALVD